VVKNDLGVKPLSGKRAFEEIAGQIRDLIYTRKLKPGDKLPPERDLAEMYNAGRTAVRESLRILEHSDLITVRKGCEGGSFVREVDSSAVSRSFIDVIHRRQITMENFVDVKIGVEKLAIGSAMARISPEELELLRKSVQETESQFEDAAREGRLPDLDPWVAANANFHAILARATKNPLLEMIAESLNTVMGAFLDDLQLVEENFRGHILHHKEIYEAVKNKDLRLAERLLEEHAVWVGRTLSMKRGRERQREAEVSTK
jgi:GntR family transcriptional regulator, transcriptional repressor for pyruvate dehydrogenase complex